ncbi:glycerate kinase [Schleiferilactobacillus shenzhenensis]|uniref:glycerate kinase n=1 Tax=Schleiferilactobacillus shenzhenensis TaxID=1231337 RepID=UPI0003F5BE11|nr:glycerate kinase [Schleiferilactobacillus shenzhenensis]
MRVIVAATAFTKELDGLAASQLLADGVQTAVPDARVDIWSFPPPGRLLLALQRIVGGTVRTIPVTGAYGAPTVLPFLQVGPKTHPTAYVETDALFPALTPATAARADQATSFGLGEGLLHLLIDGTTRIVLLIGNHLAGDGGVGMLQALGAQIQASRRPDQRVANPLLTLTGLDASRPALMLQKATLTIMTDSRFTYTGLAGFSGMLAARQHLAPRWQERFNTQLRLAEAQLAPARHITIAGVPGSGAGGGLAGALLAVGGQAVVPFTPWFCDQVGLTVELRQADFLLTAAPVLTPAMGLVGGVVPLARLARQFRVPSGIALQADHTPDPRLSRLFTDIYLTQVTGLMGSTTTGVWRRSLKVAGSELLARFCQRQKQPEN